MARANKIKPGAKWLGDFQGLRSPWGCIKSFIIKCSLKRLSSKALQSARTGTQLESPLSSPLCSGAVPGDSPVSWLWRSPVNPQVILLRLMQFPKSRWVMNTVTPHQHKSILTLFSTLCVFPKTSWAKARVSISSWFAGPDLLWSKSCTHEPAAYTSPPEPSIINAFAFFLVFKFLYSSLFFSISLP